MAEEFRLRVVHGKRGRLRFLSHLEMVRAIERAARRAGMPYAVTRGYNPRMKMAFGPALPVGTAGDRECLDMWLREYVAVPVALRRLAGASSEDLAPVTGKYVAASVPSLAASLTIGRYEASVEGVDAGSLGSALGRIVDSGRLEVEHKGKTKVFDLTRTLPEEVRVEGDADRARVRLATRIGQEGSLRPEQLLRAALRTTDAPDAAIAVTRTDILIEDEEGVWLRPV